MAIQLEMAFMLVCLACSQYRIVACAANALGKHVAIISLTAQLGSVDYRTKCIVSRIVFYVCFLFLLLCLLFVSVISKAMQLA